MAAAPYSSIYAALLAVFLDEVTIRFLLQNIISTLSNDLAGQLFKPPSETEQQLLMLARYRGQRQPWEPLPKFTRPPYKPKGRFWFIRGALAIIKQARIRQQFLSALFRQHPELLTLSLLESDALCQHYGFATELVDFTTSLEVAAFFATRGGMAPDIGVIYRLHPLDLCCTSADAALFEAAGEHTSANDPGVKSMWKKFHENRQTVAALTKSQVEEVELPNVARIVRQKGLFIWGFRGNAARQFLQVIRFKQHNGVVYEESLRNITSSWLLPADDPIEKIARPFRVRLETEVEKKLPT